MSDNIAKYEKRYKDWRDVSITQLSNVNNILLTLSSGLFIFCLEKSKKFKFYINFHNTINWESVTYWISIFLLFISILYGICVLLTRLYDFRVSRHIAITRLRFLKENQNKDKKELPYNDWENYRWTDRVTALWQITFCRLPFLTTNQARTVLTDQTLENDFQSLRKLADILGTASWRWTKVQIAFFLLSGVTYLIHQLCYR